MPWFRSSDHIITLSEGKEYNKKGTSILGKSPLVELLLPILSVWLAMSCGHAAKDPPACESVNTQTGLSCYEFFELHDNPHLSGKCKHKLLKGHIPRTILVSIRVLPEYSTTKSFMLKPERILNLSVSGRKDFKHKVLKSSSFY